MAKKLSKIHCLYNVKMLPLTETYRQNKKHKDCSKYLLSIEVSVINDEDTTPVRIIYVRTEIRKMTILLLSQLIYQFP